MWDVYDIRTPHPTVLNFLGHVPTEQVSALKKQGISPWKKVEAIMNTKEQRHKMDNAMIDRNSLKLLMSSSGQHQQRASVPSKDIKEDLDKELQKHIMESRSKNEQDDSWIRVFGVPTDRLPETERPLSIAAEFWKRDMLERWILRTPKNINQDPNMTKITHFHRLGPEMNFEFLCTFQCMMNPKHKRSFWMPYVIFVTNARYAHLLTNEYQWDARSNERAHFERYEDSDIFSAHDGSLPEDTSLRALDSGPSDTSYGGTSGRSTIVFSDEMCDRQNQNRQRQKTATARLPERKGPQAFWPKHLPDVPRLSDYKIKTMSQKVEYCPPDPAIRRHALPIGRAPETLKSLAKMIRNGRFKKFMIVSDSQNDNINLEHLEGSRFASAETAQTMCRALCNRLTQKVPGEPGPLQRFVHSLAKKNVLLAHYTLCVDGRDWVLPLECAAYGEWFDPRLVEVRGTFMRARCSNKLCKVKQDAQKMLKNLKSGEFDYCANCNDIIRPDVYFPDELLMIPENVKQDARTHAGSCDLMIIVGDDARDNPWLNENMRTYRENSIWIRSRSSNDPTVYCKAPFEGPIETTLETIIEYVENNSIILDE